jgi:hypothetical protein
MKRAFLLLFAAAFAASCDPVHDDAVAALGGEAPGVPPGPLHRPGQPCLICHDGTFGDPPAFSMAGTVFLYANSTSQVASGATVTLEDKNGTTAAATINPAGNFFLTPDTYSPEYPVHVKSLAQGNVSISMHSHIGGNGSCAGCHVDPEAPDSPGHVYLHVFGATP